MALTRVPVFALMVGILAIAMTGPAAMAAADGQWRVARGFLQAGLFTLVVAATLGLALATRGHGGSARRELFVLVLCWFFVPVFAAVPLFVVTPSIGVEGAIFEMLIAFTTTGGSAYFDLSGLPRAVHLWRGTVGWLGGLLSLTAAYVVLAPRRLGGFEIEAATWRLQESRSTSTVHLGAATAPLEARIARALRVIVPAYAVLTAALALLLSAAGQGELAAIVHAMAILSTSGISPSPQGFAAQPNLSAEALAAAFLLVATSRRLYSRAAEFGRRDRLAQDPEFWTMAALVALVVGSLFLRHWIGALTITSPERSSDPLAALWGMLFTVLSFLTTTGFVSAFWDSARDWSGWANPGLVLLALAAIGGGAATTAGGIKLIRAYALIRHGAREIERLAQPHSVLGTGSRMRSLLREGPALVWTFIMLFIFAIVATLFALTALGLGFESALVAAIAAIANTGPAFALVTDNPAGFAMLTEPQRAVLAVTMVVGRIEALALVALFNPDAWRGLPARRRIAPAKERKERTGKSADEAPLSRR